MIRQHVFPDSPYRCLFRAAPVDPRSSPVEAFRAAFQLGPTLPGVGGWPETPSETTPSVQVEDVLTAVTALPCPACPLLSSSLAGVYVPFSTGWCVETSLPPVLPPLCPLAGLTPAVDGVSGYSALGLSDHYAKPWPSVDCAAASFSAFDCTGLTTGCPSESAGSERAPRKITPCSGGTAGVDELVLATPQPSH